MAAEELVCKENLGFPKADRLHHRSLVEGLYRYGKTFYEFPFRVSWRVLTAEQLEKNFRNSVPENIGPMQFMVTVPKKKRRKAVDRVLMRRRIREAYRLNRGEILKSLPQNLWATISIGVVYIHTENLPYSVVEDKMCSLLTRLANKLQNKAES